MPKMILLPRRIGELKKELEPGDRIVITTCSVCPEECGVRVKSIARELSREYSVVGFVRYPVSCIMDYVEEFKPRVASRNPTALVVMACTAAVKAHEKLYPNLKVVEGCVTVGVGAQDPSGEYLECIIPCRGMEEYRGLRIKMYNGEVVWGGGE